MCWAEESGDCVRRAKVGAKFAQTWLVPRAAWMQNQLHNHFDLCLCFNVSHCSGVFGNLALQSQRL